MANQPLPADRGAQEYRTDSSTREEQRFRSGSPQEPNQRKGSGRPGQPGTGPWGRSGEFPRPGFPPPFPPPPMERMAERPWAGYPDYQDGQSTLPLPLRMALPELAHVPTLRPKVLRMAELLQERQRLETERRRSAQKPGEVRNVGSNPNRVREYHELLEAEDRIVAEMGTTMDTIRNDATQILEEIRLRRDHLAQRQEQILGRLESEPAAEPGVEGNTGEPIPGREGSPSQTELRQIKRADRLLALLQDRVTRLREGKSGPEAARRMLRGGIQEFLGFGGWMGGGMRERSGGPPPPERMAAPPDDPGRPPAPEDPSESRDPAIHRRMKQIERESQALRERLKELDRERDELKRYAPEPRPSPMSETNPPTKP